MGSAENKIAGRDRGHAHSRQDRTPRPTVALMQSTRVGEKEKELAALFEFVCKKEGADDLAYDTIIMSDKNHAYGHYHIYDRTLEDGDFLILDAGADFGHYKVDFSSSFPGQRTLHTSDKRNFIPWQMKSACSAWRPIVLGSASLRSARKSRISSGKGHRSLPSRLPKPFRGAHALGRLQPSGRNGGS